MENTGDAAFDTDCCRQQRRRNCSFFLCMQKTKMSISTDFVCFFSKCLIVRYELSQGVKERKHLTWQLYSHPPHEKRKEVKKRMEEE